MTARALLIDFGGVLTTDVFSSFSGWAGRAGLPRDAVRDAFAADERAQRLLVDLETGAIPIGEFDRDLAALLGSLHGVEIAPEGICEGLNEDLRLVPPMVELTESVRAAGVPTVLVSNSMGYDAYSLVELDRLFDAVVLSGRVGVRKPSRRIYRLGAEAAGVDAAECVLVDDIDRNLAGAARLGVRGVLHADAETTAAALEEHLGLELGGAVGSR